MKSASPSAANRSAIASIRPSTNSADGRFQLGHPAWGEHLVEQPPGLRMTGSPLLYIIELLSTARSGCSRQPGPLRSSVYASSVTRNRWSRNSWSAAS